MGAVDFNSARPRRPEWHSSVQGREISFRHIQPMEALNAASPTRLPERRRQRRQRVWLAGELHAGGRTLATCQVQNLDAAGAQVRLDGPCLLPVKFDLALPAAETQRQATILWRRGLLVGLRFAQDPAC
ncbi:MAG TPA: hypothetical protein PLF78_13565 [Caulobacter sp.]|nr:hypothetical protein [Caulobacter sp.]